MCQVKSREWQSSAGVGCVIRAEGEGRPQHVVHASQRQAARGMIDLGSADPSVPRCWVRSGCGLWSASFRAAFWAWRG